jgi:hypothetical protein
MVVPLATSLHSKVITSRLQPSVTSLANAIVCGCLSILKGLGVKKLNVILRNEESKI